jgi:hypothetical protein
MEEKGQFTLRPVIELRSRMLLKLVPLFSVIRLLRHVRSPKTAAWLGL